MKLLQTGNGYKNANYISAFYTDYSKPNKFTLFIWFFDGTFICQDFRTVELAEKNYSNLRAFLTGDEKIYKFVSE